MSGKISVDADALRQVLQALSGPAHYIRELQVTRNLDELMGTAKNPINILTTEYNEGVKQPMAAEPFGGNAELMDSYQAMQEELNWVKGLLAEKMGYIGPLGSAVCPLSDWFEDYRLQSATSERLAATLEVKEQQLKVAREYAEKKGLEAATYLPKILQLTALLKRARVDVNYSFQMNADLERHQVFGVEETKPITAAADKYQEFLDEIDAALWVPPAHMSEMTESEIKKMEAPSKGKYDDLYEELIMAVGNKYSGESRHMTALRYIKQAEEQSNDPLSESKS